MRMMRNNRSFPETVAPREKHHGQLDRASPLRRKVFTLFCAESNGLSSTYYITPNSPYQNSAEKEYGLPLAIFVQTTVYTVYMNPPWS